MTNPSAILPHLQGQRIAELEELASLEDLAADNYDLAWENWQNLQTEMRELNARIRQAERKLQDANAESGEAQWKLRDALTAYGMVRTADGFRPRPAQ